MERNPDHTPHQPRLAPAEQQASHEAAAAEIEALPRMQPKIWAACLAAYNDGRLHGSWIHADQEPDYLMAEIQDMLEASPVRGAEEWAIHDYEGFGAFNLHEYERLDTIARVAGGLALHGPAFAHWIHDVGSDAEDATETFTDAYRGTFESMASYAEQLVEEMGHDPIREGADWLTPYIRIDYEMHGRDLSSELSTHADDDGVHVFGVGL